MKKGKIFFDFEFNESKEQTLNLVCVAMNVVHGDTGESEKHTFWLHEGMQQQCSFNNLINLYIEKDYYFVAFAVIAEARSLLSLPFPPDVTKMKWIDLWIEYRALLNHHNKTGYGKQLIKGKIKKTFPPKPKWMEKNDKDSNDKPEDNYAACCFKLLDVEIDTDRKKLMRDVIISEDAKEIERNKKEIIEYCKDDVRWLPKILKVVIHQQKKRLPKKQHKNIVGWMLSRGEFAARTAVMEHQGYPINYNFTKNFSDNVSDILGDIQSEINELFPDTAPFRYNAKVGTFSWNQKATKDWVGDGPYADAWPLTPKGAYSLSVDAFTNFYDFKHSYPKDNLGAQFVRYLKTKQNLNGFSANTKKKTLWDSVGRDNRVRPYTNIYRSQSSRSQPSSTSFMFLKAAWMRALVQPISGWAMGGIDFGSQEFLIGALLSDDSNMLEAYQSGDVYLWFGKKTGKIPQDADKSHPLRDRFKSSVLGIMYLMMAKSLSIKITNDSGEECTEEEAQEYIDYFDNIFWRFSEKRDEFWQEYVEQGHLLLRDGWPLWGDNENHRSVKNFPIQGAGAVIMRRSVALAQDAGLKIPFTLHDALYQEMKNNSLGYTLSKMDTLATCMDKAFRSYFPEQMEKANVRLDGSIWSPDFEDKDEYVETPSGMVVKKQKIYIDARSRTEYEQFKKYFVRDEVLDLL